MLMLIGALQFRVAPFNATEYSHSHGATFAEKPVMGARPPVEFTGDAAETWSIRAVLFPQTFGGEGSLILLALMRRSGQPQYMFRGDGALMGWVVVENVTERSTRLDPAGVGKVIEVDIALRRTGPPEAAGFYQAVTGIFGSLF